MKTRRLTVELRLEGQQEHRMQGAEPQRQEACKGPGRTSGSATPQHSTKRPPPASLVSPSPAELGRRTLSPDVTPSNCSFAGRAWVTLFPTQGEGAVKTNKQTNQKASSVLITYVTLRNSTSLNLDFLIYKTGILQYLLPTRQLGGSHRDSEL